MDVSTMAFVSDNVDSSHYIELYLVSFRGYIYDFYLSMFQSSKKYSETSGRVSTATRVHHGWSNLGSGKAFGLKVWRAVGKSNGRFIF